MDEAFRLRAERGLSYNAIAKRLGISKSTLARWFCGTDLAPEPPRERSPIGVCHKCRGPAYSRYRKLLWCDECLNPTFEPETIDEHMARLESQESSCGQWDDEERLGGAGRYSLQKGVDRGMDKLGVPRRTREEWRDGVHVVPMEGDDCGRLRKRS
jgi:transcriptional regulator with XRE-family HTH domain